MNHPALPGDPLELASSLRDPGAASAERFVAEAVATESVGARRRDRWRSELARSELSVTTALLGALGTARTTLLLTDGVELVGSVVSVGEDVVVLRSTGRDWWVALATVEAVRGDQVRPGDPEDLATLRLDEVLASLVRVADVSVVTTGGASLDGEVRAVGEGVVIVGRSGGEVVVDPSRISRVARRSRPHR